MRIILYTGKGGVGKTSLSASTAILSARKGHRTLVMSSDPAHSLGDSLDRELTGEPTKIEENLYAMEVNTIFEMEKGWKKVQDYITSLFTSKTVKDISTEEITILPGMEDLISLNKILEYYESNDYDVIIVDCAPTGETLAFLSFPNIFKWWMEKFWKSKRFALKIARPIMEPIFKVPLPKDDVADEIEKLYENLGKMNDVLTNKDITSIRIVVNPEKMVIKEAQRSFTYLNIYNFNVDAVVINRLMPEEVKDEYFKGWKDMQQKYKNEIIENFTPIPIYTSYLQPGEVVGEEKLYEIAHEIFKDEDPTEIKFKVKTQDIVKTEEGYTLSIYAPFLSKEDLSLNKKGDELIIKTNSNSLKRNVILPKTLTGFEVSGAKFSDEYINIKFTSMKKE